MKISKALQINRGNWLACDGDGSVTDRLAGLPLSQASQLPHFL